MESLSISLSFPLAKVVDSSIVVVDQSVDSSVVSKGECVVEKGISISISFSLSFPLHNMLDSSVLSNVLGAKDTVRDSSVVLRVVVVGDGVSGDLGLGIDHRADSGIVDSRGGDSVVVGDGVSGDLGL